MSDTTPDQRDQKELDQEEIKREDQVAPTDPAPDSRAMANEAGDAARKEAADSSKFDARASQPTGMFKQDEIDSVLGFGNKHGKDEAESGIRAILSSTLVSYERLPMLELVFDRLIRLMSTSLRNFTSENVEVSLHDIRSIRFGDYLESIALPAIIGIFKAEEWDNFGLMTVDSSLVYAVVEVLLGARRGTALRLIEERPFTTIERNLVERMIQVILTDMSAAFEPLTPVTFRFERMETNPRFAAITRPADTGVTFSLHVAIEDRGGRLKILLPYGTLEPIRDLLLQMFVGEKFGRDPIWETHLATELWATEVEIVAVLSEQTFPLRQVMALKVGSTVMLNVEPDSPVLLRCGGVDWLTGRLGRRGQNIAVRVERSLRTQNKAP